MPTASIKLLEGRVGLTADSLLFMSLPAEDMRDPDLANLPGLCTVLRVLVSDARIG
jgi:hypothetical protein